MIGPAKPMMSAGQQDRSRTDRAYGRTISIAAGRRTLARAAYLMRRIICNIDILSLDVGVATAFPNLGPEPFC